MSRTWNSRDLEIIESLTRRVRLLSVDQIAAGWWRGAPPLRTVRRSLRRLAATGLLLRSVVNAHPLLALTKPLAQWRPGGSPPDFDAVSLQARKRWAEVPTPHEVYFAGPLAANLFGSTARGLPPMIHRDHDLLLAQVYVLYRTKRREESLRWVGEDSLPKAGYRIKDPDAFLVDGDGHIERVVESAGRYGPAQVESFHDYCRERGLPYELW